MMAILLVLAVVAVFTAMIIYDVKDSKKFEKRMKDLHKDRLELIYEVERLQGLRED